ncbi:MAG TPA: type II toxin-antitoxin system VapC family toxin [Candidatus Binatia bacterium]|nr:type II toxin-antitoxin system VapC family toxin [Candidatus Binatia bacterium]
MSTYADTSLLVSLYVFDHNSRRASAILAELPRPLILTPLLEIEIANAFHLRIFRKESDEGRIRLSWKLFEDDVQAGIFAPRPLTDEVFVHARQLAMRATPRLGVRTLDLLHVASAAVLKTEAFCTFDKKQAAVARSEGLLVRAN